MKRKIYAGYIGFQPANDATKNFVELSEEPTLVNGIATSESDAVAAELLKGSLVTANTPRKIIAFDDAEYAKELAAYKKAEEADGYVIAKNNVAIERQNNGKDLLSKFDTKENSNPKTK